MGGLEVSRGQKVLIPTKFSDSINYSYSSAPTPDFEEHRIGVMCPWLHSYPN